MKRPDLFNDVCRLKFTDFPKLKGTEEIKSNTQPFSENIGFRGLYFETLGEAQPWIKCRMAFHPQSKTQT